MGPAEIKYDGEAVSFTVDGETVVSITRDDAVSASLENVAAVTTNSLERALADYEEQDATSVSAVFLSDVPADEFDPDLSTRDVWLGFLGSRLTAEIGRGLKQDETPVVHVAKLLAPLLQRHHAELVGSFNDEQEGHVVEVHSVGQLGADRTLGELFDLATEAQALLDAAVGAGQLTARTVRGLLAGGHIAALLGQPEAPWIDAKEIPHRLEGEASGVELGKDVAAFANTGDDAIVVWGVRTAKAPAGGDVLDAVRPFELAKVGLDALRSALAARLVPLLTDVDIQVVEVREGTGYGVGWIFIPAQGAHIRPVLVRGALEGTKYLGTHVSVPVRVGEDTRHWDASTLHSLIQAGRVALQQTEEK
jgi:hypothetical protein